MAPKFKKGDIVQLKSGGPDMVIESAGPNTFGKDVVQCSWFAGSKLQHGRFDPEALKMAEKKGEDF